MFKLGYKNSTSLVSEKQTIKYKKDFKLTFK